MEIYSSLYAQNSFHIRYLFDQLFPLYDLDFNKSYASRLVRGELALRPLEVDARAGEFGTEGLLWVLDAREDAGLPPGPGCPNQCCTQLLT